MNGTTTPKRKHGESSLNLRPRGRTDGRSRSFGRLTGKGQDRAVDELGLIALIGGEKRVNLWGGLEGVGFSVGLGLAAGTGTGTAPGRRLGRSL